LTLILLVGAEMKKNIYDFKVIIEPDESGGFVVSCPSLQGCYTQGDTLDEALENIKEAILLCLDELKKSGEQIPDPSKLLIGSVLVSR
jgi:antitoxin HicB